MVDELLNEFINESREHLGTIEADLLAIEQAGADRDDALVNKVFRAAHSIKGGSAFFGLTRIKDLAHKAETVLDMLRSGKMTPNAEITNVLLAAFDRLREMIESSEARESADISELVEALSGLASSYLPTAEKPVLTRSVSLVSLDGSVTITLPEVDAERTRRSGQYVYCADLDLIHDLERKGKTALGVFRDIWETGEILDCLFDFDAVGTLDGPIGNSLTLRLLFATIIRPDDVGILIPDCAGKIRVICDPNQAPKYAAAPAPAESTPAPVPAPVAIPAATAPVPAAAQPAPLTVSAAPVAIDPTPFAETPAPSRIVARDHGNGNGNGNGPALGNGRTTASEATPSAPTPSGASSPSGGASSGDTTLRVQVTLLETLMNLAGEMILSRNQLRDAIARNDGRSLAIADQRLKQVTSELQDAIMQTRLQPIGNVFARFPRVVRDLSAALRKEVHLDLRGHDVAMDKSLIEGLADPLTHMVRNAVDHGIETPDVRTAAGKNRQGVVRLEARHEAGQVVVEIADDGGGIDPKKIARSAFTKGLITADRFKALSDQEALQLIFLPGLSTADKVTDVSGRGVGMDVVKTNLDRLGGQVEIQSVLGRGTLFRIKLPLTLAIIPSLIISVGAERFAIPQVSVEELLHVRVEDLGKRLDVVGGAEVLLLRDRLIPLVRFDEFLQDPSVRRDPASREPRALEVAVVTTGSLAYGLVVSTFHDTEEIVVKPLGRHIKRLREYAGATILGDGAVALILDVAGLAAKAELASVADKARAAANAGDTAGESIQSLLLFHNAPDEVCATPLDSVLRIERIRPEQVEMVAGRRTMQYRGAALPLVTLGDIAPVKSVMESTELAVIVSNVHGREIGLLGAMPVDVVESTSAIDRNTHRQRGIAGSTIVQNRTVLIANLVELVDSVHPDWAENSMSEATEEQTETAGPEGAGERRKPVVVLAEDSDFFRAQVKRYLEEDGETVLDAPDGEAAWQTLLEHVGEVSAVVTDVEMPRLTGLELTKRIRSDSRTSRLPVIALSSLAGEEDIARGKAAGVNDYQVKLDRERLVASLRELVPPAPSVTPA